jgi:hypothetical protein
MTVPSAYVRVSNWPDFEQQWFVAGGRDGLVFFHRPDTGVGLVGGFLCYVSAAFKELNRWEAGDFLGGWTSIVGIHSPPPLNPLFCRRIRSAQLSRCTCFESWTGLKTARDRVIGLGSVSGVTRSFLEVLRKTTLSSPGNKATAFYQQRCTRSLLRKNPHAVQPPKFCKRVCL